MERPSTFQIGRLTAFLISLSNMTGTLTTVPRGKDTRSTPMFSAMSSRSTSTKERWGLTTQKKTSPGTSVKTRLFLRCSTWPANLAGSLLRASTRFGGYCGEPDRYILRAMITGLDKLPKGIAEGL